MNRSPRVRILPAAACLALAGGLLAVPRGAAALAPPDPLLTVHPDNPRVFRWHGRPLVLVGSGEHYGSVVNPSFDFRRYLATVQAAGLNQTRIFLGDYVEGPGSFGIADNSLAAGRGRVMAPWMRSPTPGYPLGGNRFDLDRWDPAYFERLHEFFREAERRGIVVEAVLFFVGPGWATCPFNPTNNINGTTPIEPRQYLSLDNGNILARQEAYCRKLVRELNPYGNLLFDLCNEPWFFNQRDPGFVSQPPDAVKAWIRRASEWVREEESRLPNRHVLGVDLSNQGTVVTPDDLARFFPHVDVFNAHYDGNADLPRLNPSLPRLLGFNETGFHGTADDLYRVQGWRFLLSGGAFYSHLDFSFTVGHEDGSATPRFLGPTYNGGGSATLRAQLRILLEFMKTLPLDRMRPDNGFVVGGADSWHGLAWPDRALAVWFPGTGPFQPMLALPTGTWHADWVDILSGETTSERIVAERWVTTLNGTRRGGGVALRLLRPDAVPESHSPTH